MSKLSLALSLMSNAKNCIEKAKMVFNKTRTIFKSHNLLLNTIIICLLTIYCVSILWCRVMDFDQESKKLEAFDKSLYSRM